MNKTQGLIPCVLAGVMSTSFCFAQEQIGQESQNDAHSGASASQDTFSVFQNDDSNDFVKSALFTLSQEYSFGREGTVNNRSAIRFEYTKFFLEDFYISADTQFNAYWGRDYIARGKDRTVDFDSNTQALFLQYSPSGGNTSFSVGMQRLIWGESEGGAITDIVSPRNMSELFFVPLEGSRISQFMLSLEHFSAMGNWSAFIIPDAKMNQYPEKYSLYYVDAFNGQADIYQLPDGNSKHEYGMRWKKNIGQSDISFMAASLIDNDYVYRSDNIYHNGRLQISRFKQRLTMLGSTFNYATDKIMVKGEAALKAPKSYNTATFQAIEKDVFDSSIGLTYSLGQSDTIGFETVNSTIINWDDRIVSARKNTHSLVLNTHFSLVDELLSVGWLAIYNKPNDSLQSSLRTAYKWSDNVKLSVDAHIIVVSDENSALYPYRDQEQVVFRVDYKF